jgi:hypothetical protein
MINYCINLIHFYQYNAFRFQFLKISTFWLIIAFDFMKQVFNHFLLLDFIDL